MAAGDFAGAVGIYERLVKQGPANPGWKLNLGIALHMAGRDKEAVGPLEIASKAMPEAFPAHALLGTSLLRLGEAMKAIGPLQRAVAMKPSDPQGRRMLAEAFLQLKQPNMAVNQLQALTRLEPSDAGAWYVLGRANEATAAELFQLLARRYPGVAGVPVDDGSGEEEAAAVEGGGGVGKAGSIAPSSGAGGHLGEFD